MSMPLLQDTANDDEVSFVMGHEYGHLIGKHIEKQQTQAIVGALVLGAITAAATAQSTSYGTYYDTDAVAAAVDIGAAAGSMAYSQTYELEGDTLGTRIAASAGYDPLEGAKFFARPEDAKTQSGKLSFWGTHPPNEKRFATVLATMEEIEADIELKRKQN
jgi:predicted Zn-dependent protease